MALTPPTPLPPKLKLSEHIDRSEGETCKDLSPADREVYDRYWAEHNRRQDPSIPGVAQERIDAEAWLVSQKRSPAEADNIFGYSATWVTKPAKAEEKRIVRELGKNPSADVTSSMLDVGKVMVAKGIKEFVPEPEPVIE